MAFEFNQVIGNDCDTKLLSVFMKLLVFFQKQRAENTIISVRNGLSLFHSKVNDKIIVLFLKEESMKENLWQTK